MRTRIKVLLTAVTIVVLTGSGAAIAIASPWSGSTSFNPAASTSSSTAPGPSTTAAFVPNEKESVTPPTTPKNAPDPAVQAAQQKLNDIGYWVGSVDGLSGQATQQALLAFQKVTGLPKSGKLDDATKTALGTASRPTPSSTAGDVIEVDKTRQVIFFVKGGQTLWVFNTSTGTEQNYVTNGQKGFAHTPTGTFKVLRSVDKVDPGPLGPLYRPRYFTNTGIAIHGAGSIPAVRASHGCARVSNAAMDFIWSNNLMPIGSLVWVYDDAAKQPFSPPTTTTSAAPTTTVPPTTPTTAATTTSTTVAPTSSTAPAATSSTAPAATSTSSTGVQVAPPTPVG